VDEIALGATGITVPPLGIGTWAWGDSLFWKYGTDYGAEDVRAAFQTAVESGVTFFDTAEVYGLGESERLIGQFLKQTTQPVQIATKYFPLPWRVFGQSVADTLTDSLKRLQVDRVALYQVHMPFDFFMGQKTLMNALADEVEKGRIGAIGVSNYSAQQMREAHGYLAARGVPLAVNQVRYSLLTRQIEGNGTLTTAQELGVVILAYSPLAQGLLTGKYNSETVKSLQGARRIDPRFSASGLAKIEPVLNALEKIGAVHQRTIAQVALNWLIVQGNVIPIPGAKNAEQARQNAGALGWKLSTTEVEQLDGLTRAWMS
jgi:aryl-alcohol dehydrogenase-like predicted oxidoreductase